MSKSKKKQKNRYVEIYNEQNYQKDKKKFSKSLDNNKLDLATFKRLMISDLCTNSKILDTGYIGYVKLEDAIEALKYPRNHWKTILSVSRSLMHISPHYYKLNMTYSNMALFNWWIDLYDVQPTANIETLKKKYALLAAKFETMNIKHEFGKIMRVLPYQDIYMGLVVENDSTFYYQEMDYNICKVSQIQDGLYNFSIDLNLIKPLTLGAYPDYVQKAYLDYHEGQNENNWYTPPSDKQICLKLNSQYIYPYPILISLVKDLLDLDIFKKLKLQSARTDNYKAIMVKVPIDNKMVDKPLLSPELLLTFADINRESMTEDIGLIHVLGSEGEAISFKDSNNTRNNVSDAVDEVYNSAGTTKELFNGSSTGTSVKFSVENNAGYIYSLYRQFERWANRYIKLKKYNSRAFKFNFYLLDTTIYNRDDVTKRYKEACTLGATVVDKWLASLDMTPSRMLGSFVLHEDIFDFKNKFVPLSNSYNMSDKTAGRPTNESKNEMLDVEGQKTADGEKNNK